MFAKDFIMYRNFLTVLASQKCFYNAGKMWTPSSAYGKNPHKRTSGLRTLRLKLAEEDTI